MSEFQLDTVVAAIISTLLSVAAILAYIQRELERRKGSIKARGDWPERNPESDEPDWSMLAKLVEMAERADKERNDLRRDFKAMAKQLRECQDRLAGKVADKVAQQLTSTGGGESIGARLTKVEREQRNARIKALKAENKKHREIASEVGCSPSTVSRVLGMA